MVPFAGYHMPLAYGDVSQGPYPSLSRLEVSDAPTVASHQYVRQSAGLFDVGHMVQSKYALRINDVYPL
jgi:aminomethyltransferase